jgi:hypothetical protein
MNDPTSKDDLTPEGRGDEPLPESPEEFGRELIGRFNVSHVVQHNVVAVEGEVFSDRVYSTDSEKNQRSVEDVRNMKYAACGCVVDDVRKFVRTKHGLHCRDPKHQRVCAGCNETVPHLQARKLGKCHFCPDCRLIGWFWRIFAWVFWPVLLFVDHIGRDGGQIK